MILCKDVNRRVYNNSLKKGKEVNYVLKIGWLICLNLKIFRLLLFLFFLVGFN